MLTHAMWVHGHQVRIENPERMAQVWRAGFFSRLVGRPGTTNWLHLPVPTPVIVDDKRQMVHSALVRLRCGSRRATVTNVHVFDGARRIAAHDGLSLSPSAFGMERFDVPEHPDVVEGLGITLGVRFAGHSDAENTIEIASAGCDLTLMETVRLHVKTLTAPTRFTIDQMVAGMQQVYADAGIRVVRASDETLNLPDLDVVDTGECRRGQSTAEQSTLFGNRNGAGGNDVVVYFVRATNPPLNGCAAHPSGRPGAVVASGASRWTLAHEVGHVLGLNHVSPADRLMMGGGTDNITNPPPDLVASEASTMVASGLTQAP
ncbi:hypothetical protein LEP48_06075 [Isoptericola sp. NEAU-Y5]|uniref:Peptidase M10 metallopeptidase domain-containing protein n=1 Tax=Isoptericola luteus TaxID=2879484 RepID=A0ABS7ZD03_9MICO|nr:DUF6623 family protein [Isoptericola sp. NEAU-Y5]MCA5892921.1 hypothetical protein [Isoptericola sp. NEAU-Y5]